MATLHAFVSRICTVAFGRRLVAFGRRLLDFTSHRPKLCRSCGSWTGIAPNAARSAFSASPVATSSVTETHMGHRPISVRSLTEVGCVSGECHEKLVGLICGGACDLCDGRSRDARRCENLKGQAAVSSDQAPGRHNLERPHEAGIDTQLDWKNRRSDAVALSASASAGGAKARAPL